MSQSDSATLTSTHVPQTLGHWGRFIVFILTLGFVFPHVLVEGVDLAAIDDEYRNGLRK